MRINIDPFTTPREEAQAWIKLANEQMDILRDRFNKALEREDYEAIRNLINWYIIGVFTGRGPVGMPCMNISDDLKYFRDGVKKWLVKTETLSDDRSMLDAIHELQRFVET